MTEQDSAIAAFWLALLLIAIGLGAHYGWEIGLIVVGAIMLPLALIGVVYGKK